MSSFNDSKDVHCYISDVLLIDKNIYIQERISENIHNIQHPCLDFQKAFDAATEDVQYCDNTAVPLFQFLNTSVGFF